MNQQLPVVEDLHKFETMAPPESLLIGRRAIENLQEVELLEDLRWDPLVNKWVLFCSIRLAQPSDFISKNTNWYVLVDGDYPFGEIGFYPSVKEGLEITFPHQSDNGLYEDNRPWRKGKLCLDSHVKSLGKYGYNEESMNAHGRLLWHFKRALLWLTLASKNELVTSIDPFELPHFPIDSLDLIAFSESPVSFGNWEITDAKYGLVDFIELKESPQIIVTKSYMKSGKDIYSPKWGTIISESPKYPLIGLWIKLNKIPIIQPWQAPRTWGELQQAMTQQGIDLMNIIQHNARYFRDGLAHILLLGFPIPEFFFGKPIVMNWKAIKLPVLSYGNKFANGFRKGEAGYWQRDRTKIIRKEDQLHWIDTENWHRNEILNRGKLSAKISHTSILQIGAGALGSMIAEQLVRADQQKLTIVDHDVFQVGNLSRHTLGMQQIREQKAIELSRKLNLSVPHSKVRAFLDDVTNESSKITFSDYRVILDCTGEDHVLYKLSQISWNSSKIFISASLGFEAKRLYLYTDYSKHFSAEKYFKLVNPWVHKEREGRSEDEFPRDGIGCWSPIFPARIDDVWMMSSIVVKNIEKYINTPSTNPILMVYEQKWTGDNFCGIELVSQEELHE